jgi:hypothetical protein
MPPITTIAKIIAQQMRSQIATARVLAPLRASDWRAAAAKRMDTPGLLAGLDGRRLRRRVASGKPR